MFFNSIRPYFPGGAAKIFICGQEGKLRRGKHVIYEKAQRSVKGLKQMGSVSIVFVLR